MRVIRLLIATVLLLLGIVALYFLGLTPFGHAIWMALFFRGFGFWLIAAGIAGLFLIPAAILKFTRGYSPGSHFLLTLGIVELLAFFLFLFLNNQFYHKYLAQQSFETITSLPNTTQIRYLPKEVSKTFGSNRYQDSQTAPGDFHSIQIGENIEWVAARVPNGFINSISYQTQGILIVQSDGSLKSVDAPMTFGEGMAFNRSIEWQTYSRRFNSDIDTPYYILTSTNEVLTLVPSIGYHFQFPAMVPFWESTYVIHPDGTIENLSPERIQQDPRFQGQRLFPEGLAREIGNSWGYRDGIWNALFIHRNQVEPVSFEHDENQMPYLLPATDSPIWAIACSPVSQAHGINTLLLWNAHSGKMQVYTVPKTASLLGPNKAMEYVRAAYPLYNWTKDETGSVVTLEPRPVIRDSKLYWMVSVTNTNYAGVSLQTLVNAEDGSVRAFHSPDEIQAFLHGTYEGEKPPTSADTQSQQQTDISKMSDDQLFKLIDNALNELKKRREKK